MSERRWKAGELAMMTWADNMGAAFPVLRGEGRWHMLDYIVSESDDFLTDAWLAERDGLTITPLITVDMEDPAEVERLARAYVIEAKSAPWNARSEADKARVVRELQAALREFACSTPPTPAEPKGFGAMVTDDEGYPWVRIWDDNDPHSIHTPWRRGLAKRAWGDFNAVDVIREGL